MRAVFGANENRQYLIVFRAGLEDQRHQEGEDDRGGHTGACCRKRSRKRFEEPRLRTPHSAVCEQVTEPRNGHGSPCARKVHEGLIEPERGKRDAGKHEDDEDLPGGERGKIDDDLRNDADEPAKNSSIFTCRP